MYLFKWVGGAGELVGKENIVSDSKYLVCLYCINFSVKCMHFTKQTTGWYDDTREVGRNERQEWEDKFNIHFGS